MSLTRKVAGNTLVQLGSRILATASGLVIVAALTRYLGVAGYGEYTTVFGYVAFVEVIANLGFFWVMLREMSRPGADEAHIASNVLTFRALLSTLVLTLGTLVAWTIPQYSLSVKLGIAILSVAWLWMTLNATYVAVFQRYLRMEKAVIADLVGRVVVLIGVLWAVQAELSFLSILVLYVLGNFLTFAVSLALGRQFIRVRPAFDLALWKRIAIEALPMGIVLVLHVVYFKIDTVMLSLMKTPVDVGIYGAPYKMVEVLLALPVMFLGNLFPTLTQYLSGKDERLTRIFQTAFEVLALIALPIMVGTFILAKPILTFVAGPAFATTGTVMWLGQLATGSTALQILIIAVALAFFSALFNYVLVALGRQRDLVVPNLVFVAVNVIGNYFIIPKLSYIGTSLITVVTEVIVVGTLAYLVAKLTGLMPRLGQFWRITGASLVMAGMIWTVAGAPLWIPLFAALPAYALGLWIFGAIRPELLAALRQRG